MNTFQQIISAIYVAMAEAAGGPAALRIANQVLRDAIRDGAVDDPAAVALLESLTHDEDDAVPSAASALDARIFAELSTVH